MIYRESVNFFLNSFSADLDDVEEVWRNHGGFVSMEELAQALVSQKSFSPEAEKVINSLVQQSFPVDFRSGAFERQNFILGLADYYAEIANEDVMLVEFDVGNCNGTGDYVGDEDLMRVIRYMRFVFEQTLLEHNATFVESFDNAKNDDFKFIVAGVTPQTLTKALQKAQEQIRSKFIFATHIPHGKYGDERSGIGVGAGFAKLGKGRSPEDLQKHLNLFVEKGKLEDAEIRRNIRDKAGLTPMTKEVTRGFLSLVFNDEACVQVPPKVDFPFVAEGINYKSFDPFHVREDVCKAVVKETAMTRQEEAFFLKVLDFYHMSDDLTSARRSNFLFDDMNWVADQLGHDVTVFNIKVENCAGINKVLSHIHSAEMTKDFMRVLSEFTGTHFGPEASDLIYYIGRNSFNLIIPTEDAEAVQHIFETYFQEEVDREINERSCEEYFGKLGFVVPDSLRNKKVGDIKNLRGLDSGVLAINHAARLSSDFDTEVDLIKFQNYCISPSRHMIGCYELVLPNGLTYREIEEGKTPEETLCILQEMVSDILVKEQSEENSADCEDGERIPLDVFLGRQPPPQRPQL
jgi:RNA binding exosome subunit